MLNRLGDYMTLKKMLFEPVFRLSRLFEASSGFLEDRVYLSFPGRKLGRVFRIFLVQMVELLHPIHGVDETLEGLVRAQSPEEFGQLLEGREFRHLPQRNFRSL